MLNSFGLIDIIDLRVCRVVKNNIFNKRKIRDKDLLINKLSTTTD